MNAGKNRGSVEREEQTMSILVMTPLASARNSALATGETRIFSDQELVASAKSDEREAFGELCDRHADKVFRVTYRITRNREDAEDAVQDAFLSAFVHLRHFDERSKFATWLTRIAINAALGKLRKKRGMRELPMDEPGMADESQPHFEVPDSAPNPEETCHRNERKEIVMAALERLRPRARRVVEFNQLQERSTDETARMLGISTAAVKARMFHARIALRRMPMLKSMARSKFRAVDRAAKAS
jgi:RNA polymerase sigma-70 factor, ECF subfamily